MKRHNYVGDKMIVLQAQNISKSFGELQVLQKISLTLNEKERVGLIGANGSGKTTLLHCLTGALEPDEGEICRAATFSLGCLEQLNSLQPGMTAWTAMMENYTDLIRMRQRIHELERAMGTGDQNLAHNMDVYGRLSGEYEKAGGYECETTARRILIGLGFSQDEFEKPLEHFSGGQKTRLNLGRLLALSPDVLLLDEPTNHLDMESVEWLERFINTYPGTVLIVSHDRMMLDRVVTRIAEIRNGKLQTYSGNYSEYIQKRAAEDLGQQRAYAKQQEHIRQTEAYIRRFKAGIKAKQARGRQSQLDRLERLKAPDQSKKINKLTMSIDRESGQSVLAMKDVGIAFGGKELFSQVGLDLKKGQKFALVGPNGSGKTTLLKIAFGSISPDQGEVRVGSRVDIAYFSQVFENLNPQATVLEEIYQKFEITLEEARTALGGLLFYGDDVLKKVENLSGGERSRLCILQMILSGANLLLIDEPTNHLDIESCEAVEQMLSGYNGSILLVSHDRYFIDQVADGIVALERRRLNYYCGNYSYYQQKRQEQQTDRADNKEISISPQARERECQKEMQRSRRTLIKNISESESLIQKLEDRKKELEILLFDPLVNRDLEKLCSLHEEYLQLEPLMEKAMLQWEQASQALLQLDATERQASGED
jgi:ATP-binding cassette subfamily F protein 3